MKVSQTSSRQLTLRSVPWTTGLVSILFIAVGLVSAVLFGEKSVLECDRAGVGQCTLSHWNLANSQTRTFAIASLQEAEVDTSKSSDGDTHRVVLLTHEGAVPLTRSYDSNRRKSVRQAAAANRFIQTATMPQLRLGRDRRWVGLLVLFCFSGGGLLLLINTKVATCEFDKSTNRLALRLQGLLGSKSHHYSLQQISGLRVELSQRAASKDDKKEPSSRLTIVLKTGEVIPLSKIYAGDTATQAKVARQVHEFLRLPLLPHWDSSQVMLDQTKIALQIMTGGTAQRLATIERCQQTLRQDPNDVEAHHRLAAALSMQGQKDQAKQLLESARGRCQSYGEFEKAAHLDHVLSLLKLKHGVKWWEAI